jgi:hypothetical protein
MSEIIKLKVLNSLKLTIELNFYVFVQITLGLGIMIFLMIQLYYL